jgi:hypothetical protein
MSHDHDTELEDHDRGLSFDLPTLISRRRALGVLSGSVMTAALAACGSSPKSTASSASGSSADGTGEIPDETAGPYPGDGSNGPNVLTESGIVRSDITTSSDGATSAGSKLKTSQIALPKDACDVVYATAGYEQSVRNLAQTSLDTDNVFGDGYASQLATTSGTVDSRIAIKLNVGV